MIGVLRIVVFIGGILNFLVNEGKRRLEYLCINVVKVLLDRFDILIMFLGLVLSMVKMFLFNYLWLL